MGTWPPGYSIVVEMENTRSIDWDEVGVGLAALAREIENFSSADPSKPTVVISHSGGDADSLVLRRNIATATAELEAVANLRFLACPGARYYVLKNNGVLSAHGDIVVFYDSDTVAEDGWLAALLDPFRDDATVAVNGYTYLLHDNFLSRTFALAWFFPLAQNDTKFASKRAINANNVAFRRNWIADHPFPESNGFKVSCTLLLDELHRGGRELVCAEARVGHYPPRGWRFFCWRALVTGRDADRKLVARKFAGRSRRIAKAFSRWFTMTWRTTRRIIWHARSVGMPVWQIPFSLLVGLAFHSLAFFGQLTFVLGLVSDQTEVLPDHTWH